MSYNNNAISSDDPKAIEKLTEKLHKCETEQEFMKNVNAYYKKNGCLPDTTPKTTPSPHPLQFKLEVLYWQQLHDASDLKTAVTFKLRGMEIVSKWRKHYLQGGKFRLIRDRDGKVKLVEKKKLVVRPKSPVPVKKADNLPQES